MGLYGIRKYFGAHAVEEGIDGGIGFRRFIAKDEILRAQYCLNRFDIIHTQLKNLGIRVR